MPALACQSSESPPYLWAIATLGWLATAACCASGRGWAPPAAMAETPQATAAGPGLGMGEADAIGGHLVGIVLSLVLLYSTGIAVRGPNS